MARGGDWRQVARMLMAQMPHIRQSNIGFLYVTDELAQDAASLFHVLRRISRIPHWLGGCGLAAFADGGALHGEPGAVMLAGRVPDGCVQFPELNPKSLLESRAPFAMIHADVRVQALPLALAGIQALPMFTAGGLMVNQGGPRLFQKDKIQTHPIGLCTFDSRQPVVTALFQGCQPFGRIRTVTAADGARLIGLDHRPAREIFTLDLMQLAKQDIDITGQAENIHIGLVHSGSDRGDYAVRGLNAIDPETEYLHVASQLAVGQKIRFVYRNQAFARAAMGDGLEKLMRRVRGMRCKPVAAHYVSCVGRVPYLFNDKDGIEMTLLKNALGDIPVAGYYAMGEISRGELHHFAGVLTVFLE